MNDINEKKLDSRSALDGRMRRNSKDDDAAVSRLLLCYCILTVYCAGHLIFYFILFNFNHLLSVCITRYHKIDLIRGVEQRLQ